VVSYSELTCWTDWCKTFSCAVIWDHTSRV